MTNELRGLLADTVTRLFTDLVTKELIESAERGVWPDKLWRALSVVTEKPIAAALIVASLVVLGVSWKVQGSRIVGDVQHSDLVHRPRPAMYLPPYQDHGTRDVIADWAVKTSGDPAARCR